ncbi:MAG: ATP-grasp domain-containing protein [Gammaproteobacteria bacterium]|nr:ATP-grasp domain-containing protein [Gammaproteobacteria bacterium]
MSRNAELVLILAHAGRQLAAAARAASFRPLVIDRFGDRDTRDIAHEFRSLPCDGRGAIDGAAVVALVAQLRATYGAVPLVWGGGLEGSHPLLAKLEASGPVLGTALVGVRELVDPSQTTDALAALAIPYPALAFSPQMTPGWLRKRRGGSGGGHVQEHQPGETLGADEYLQRVIAGTVHSLTFMAAAEGCRGLSFNRHLDIQLDPAARYRYGGACAVTDLPRAVTDACLGYAHALTTRFGLRGLCGFDFVLAADATVVLIDINPRPTATFDLGVTPGSAFAAHMATCRGGAVPLIPQTACRGHVVYYASDAIQIPNWLDWPPWVADRPRPGTQVAKGDPLCTLAAAGRDADEVAARLRERVARLTQTLHGAGADPAKL